jgi:acetylornithine deacetylase/succinyl-diaminopimelate desuccinylase-like protein
VLTIVSHRLWDSLTGLARFDATPKGGVRRLALTDEDRRGRDRFVRHAAEKLGHSHLDMVSAAHDAVYMSRITPTAMIFVPCAAGISHDELESARREHLAAGCDVLPHAVLRRAGAATEF